MKLTFPIFLIFCLTQQNLFVNAEPDPQFVDYVKHFFGYDDSHSNSDYNNAVIARSQEINNDTEAILSDLEAELEEKKLKFLSEIPSAFNSSFNVFDDNNTSSFVRDIFDGISLEICSNTSMLSKDIQWAQENICDGDPTFDEVLLRAKNLTNAFEEDVLHSLACSFDRIKDTLASIIDDGSEICNNITDSDVKEDIIADSKAIDKCMEQYIDEMNSTLTSSTDCPTLIHLLSEKIENILQTLSNNTDVQYYEALQSCLSQKLKLLDSCLTMKMNFLHCTQEAINEGLDCFVNRLFEFADKASDFVSSFPSSIKSAIEAVTNSNSTGLSSVFDPFLGVVNDVCDWGKLMFDFKRAKFCEALNCAESIQNFTCTVFNTTKTIIDQTTKNLDSQVDKFMKNLDCFKDSFNLSSFVSLMANMFTSGVSFAESTVSLVKNLSLNLKNNIMAQFDLGCAAIYRQFNENCTIVLPSIESINLQLLADLKSCNKNTTVIDDLCNNDFQFSFWNPMASLNSFLNLFKSTAGKLQDESEKINDCLHDKIEKAGSLLKSVSQKCRDE